MKKEDAIPKGIYCYDDLTNKQCPYWHEDTSRHYQERGYCKFLDIGDWDIKGISLLWDKVKYCGINIE